MKTINRIVIRKNEANDASLNTSKLFLKPSKDTTFVWGIMTDGDVKYSIVNGNLGADGVAKLIIQKPHEGRFYYVNKNQLVDAHQDMEKKVNREISLKLDNGYEPVELEEPINAAPLPEEGSGEETTQETTQETGVVLANE